MTELKTIDHGGRIEYFVDVKIIEGRTYYAADHLIEFLKIMKPDMPISYLITVFEHPNNPGGTA